jgi:predicted nucleic acid-binding Zn ribbon protein
MEAALPKRDPTGVGDILSKLKQKTSLGKQLDQAKIWEHWPELAGDPLWMHGRPRAVKKMRLYVEVESPVWMHQYALKKWGVIRRINRLAGYELVSDIYVELMKEGSPGEAQDGG